MVGFEQPLNFRTRPISEPFPGVTNRCWPELGAMPAELRKHPRRLGVSFQQLATKTPSPPAVPDLPQVNRVPRRQGATFRG